MGLYKRKDSRFYWMSLRTRGRRVSASTGTDNRKLADRIHAKWMLEAHEGRLSGPLSRTIDGSTEFTELARQYLTWAERQKAFRSKAGFIKQLCAVFKNTRLGNMALKEVERYQTEGLKSGKAPATMNRHIEALKHMFTKAVEWDLVDEAVLKRVRRVKKLRENNRRLRFLSREEGAALVAACDAHLKPVVVTALNTGMRKEEILSLEWNKHIDLKHGFILLDVTKNGERRELPINQTLRAALAGLVRRIHCPFVFCDKQGRRFRDVKRSFASALRRVGLKDFRFHDLRHTFASQLVMSGVDLTTVSRLLGHKSLTMTLRYAHLAPAHMLKAVSVLDAPAAGGYDLATLGKNEGAALKATP